MNTPVKADRATNLQMPGDAAAPEVVEAPAKEDKPKAPKAEKSSERIRTKADYRTMRAADINVAELTSPVLSAEGWVCPPAPEKK